MRIRSTFNFGIELVNFSIAITKAMNIRENIVVIIFYIKLSL